MTGFLGTVGMIQAFHKMATAGQIEVGALIRRNLHRYDNYRWTCCGIIAYVQSTLVVKTKWKPMLEELYLDFNDPA
jgi:hypothetical protein